MTVDAVKAGSALDPQALAALKREVRAGDESPETLRAVAKQFESVFAQMLIKSMRATSFGGGLMDSEQSDFYRDIFDQQLAVDLSHGRGLGLADMLVQQLSKSPLGADGERATGLSSAPGPLGTRAAPVTGPANSAAVPLSDRTDFVRELWPHAEAAGRALGVDPTLIVSHAALESGWGRATPVRADGATSHNLFGIKAGANWTGASANATTTEFEAGQAERRVETFRAYGSRAASVADYARLLAGSPRYAAALNSGTDATAFAGALQRAGYATDPAYAGKLVDVARQVRALRDDTSLKVASFAPITPATTGAT
jgi:flagellar protein FlgJ